MSFAEMAYQHSEEKRLRRLWTKTRPTSGTLSRKFSSAAPSAPKVAQPRTAITNGFEFSWNVVSGASGYNILRALVNNVNVATVVAFVGQPLIATGGRTRSLKWQEITSASPFYWVATVSSHGDVSVPAFIPMAGTASPTPPPESPPPDMGGGGGGGGRDDLLIL